MNPTTSAPVIQSDAEFLSDLAARLFKHAAPMQGFDQGDVDRLYRIARTRLALGEGEKKPDAERERWESCNCPEAPFDDEVVYDQNLSPRCPRCNVALGGDPMTDSARAAMEAEEAASLAHPDPLAAGASEEAGVAYDGRNLNDWQRAVEIASGWYSEDYPDDRDIRIAVKGIEIGRKLAAPALQVPVSDDLRSAVCEVLNKAWCLLDSTANENPPEVPQEDWDALSEAMDKLEALIPESEQPCWPGVAARLLARQALAALSAPSQAGEGWRDISSAPLDGTTALVSFGTRGVHAVAWAEPSYADYELWCVDDGKHGPYGLRGYSDTGPTAPTHWMPLPAAPVQAGEE